MVGPYRFALVGRDHRARRMVPHLLHDERRERDRERLAFGAATRDERQLGVVVRAFRGRITAKRRNLVVSAVLVEVARERVVRAVHAYSPMPHALTNTLHPCGLTVVPKATVDVPKRQGRFVQTSGTIHQNVRDTLL